ncbi:MAG: phage baseplate assembly protein V [Caulobacteraceae bacterium]
MSGPLRRALAPIHDALRSMVGRAVIRVPDDSGEVRLLQADLLADETIDAVEHMQSYGFSSMAKAGSDGVFLSVAGRRAGGVVICVVDRESRFTGLQPGEAVLYDDQGQVVHLKRDGIWVESTKPVTVKGQDVTVEATGTLTLKAPHIILDSADVKFGGAGANKAVARVGDTVAGGLITTGAAGVKST